MIDNNFGYYECGICGHQTQIITETPGQVEQLDPETGDVILVDVLIRDLDGEASFQAACEHEKEHQ